MKLKALGVTLFLAGAVLPGAAASYTITVPTGWSYVANHLSNSNGNTLDVLFPSVPDGTSFIKYQNATQTWLGTVTFYAGAGWLDTLFNPRTVMLNPGEGGVLINLGLPFNVTFTGSTVAPVLPVVVPPGAFFLVSRRFPGPGTYLIVVGCPPQEGASVYRFDPTTQMLAAYTYAAGVWNPAVPEIDVGESVFIRGPTCAGPECIPITVIEAPKDVTLDQGRRAYPRGNRAFAGLLRRHTDR